MKKQLNYSLFKSKLGDRRWTILFERKATIANTTDDENLKTTNKETSDLGIIQNENTIYFL